MNMPFLSHTPLVTRHLYFMNSSPSIDPMLGAIPNPPPERRAISNTISRPIPGGDPAENW
jgi:hypothetical protein